MVDVDVEEGILFAGGSAVQSIDFRPPGPGDLPRLIEVSSLLAPNPKAPAIDLEMLDFLPCCRYGSFGTSPGAGEGDLLLPILRENEKLLRREETRPSACCDDCERSDGFGETDRWDSDDNGTVPTGCGRGDREAADLGIPSDRLSDPLGT